MSEDKAELRREMRAIRASIEDHHQRSRHLCDAIIRRIDEVGREVEPRRPLVVLAFFGVASEPDTSSLLNQLYDHGHVVALPRVTDLDLSAVEWTPDSPMPLGDFGIPSPIGEHVEAATIDVAIVPGLAFTPDGHRLGQGGGFYDRLLPALRADCLTIGVCFAEQLIDHVPTEPHDRTLDTVVTDRMSE
jgi:5-formyltetrahydrofolate cyclo-ligase